MPEGDVRTLRRAGLTHDFGRLGISNAIWDKEGPLGAGERERVWMHPYFTQRMLRASKLLAPVGAIAAQHCERLDGSGYPQGESGNAIAQGLSNRQIGARLVISPKTAGNHVEHIYSKIDASSRAAASLFAMRHGLLRDLEPASAPAS